MILTSSNKTKCTTSWPDNRADQQRRRNNHEATTEEQNEAIRQVEAHSSDAIAKIIEAETDTCK